MSTVIIGAIVLAGIGLAAYSTYKTGEKGGCAGCHGCGCSKDQGNCR